MSRALSRREKALMGILAVLLIALAYYLMVYQPVEEELASIEARKLDIQSSIDVETTKSLLLARMNNELEELRKDGETEFAPMAAYDNAQNVMNELASILSTATDYDLSFSPVVTDGSLVRRSIGMSFGCAGYANARAVLEQFYNCRYRCRIGDFAITAVLPKNADAGLEPDLARDQVRVSMTVTFYELAD